MLQLPPEEETLSHTLLMQAASSADTVHPSIQSATLGRKLQQSASSATPDLVLKCPTGSQISKVAPMLKELGEEVELILAADAQGIIPAPFRPQYDYILSKTNMWRVLLPFYKSPDRMSAFLAKHCTGEALAFPSGSLYLSMTPRISDSRVTGEAPPAYDEGDVMFMCSDTRGSANKFLKGMEQVEELCDPPFGSTPDCHPPAASHMPSSRTCASALATLYNVSAPTLQEAATTITSIQNACAAVTTEVDCRNATAPPEFQKLEDLRRTFDYKEPLSTTSESGKRAAAAFGGGASVTPAGAAFASPVGGPKTSPFDTATGGSAVPTPIGSAPLGTVVTGQPITNAGPAPGAPADGGPAGDSVPLDSSKLSNFLGLPPGERVAANGPDASGAAPLVHAFAAMHTLALLACIAALVRW